MVGRELLHVVVAPLDELLLVLEKLRVCEKAEHVPVHHTCQASFWVDCILRVYNVFSYTHMFFSKYFFSIQR